MSLATSLRHALARPVEAIFPATNAADAVRANRRLAITGHAATLSYFPAWNGIADGIVAACADLSARMAASGQGQGACLAIKAPPLYFDRDNILAVAGPAAGAGMSVVFDALTPVQAEPTLEFAQWLAGEIPQAGIALPARWRRSLADAAVLRDGPLRVRVVKGEWPDPADDPADRNAAFLGLVTALAGRRAPVAVATHDPVLAERALQVLVAAGTPCELELLRGLPGRRPARVARAMGVPVRIYWPFGPGWWPYAIDKAIDRPYLPQWWLKDRFG